MYDAGLPRLIINTASPAMHIKLGHHCAAQVISVQDPMESAEKAAAMLKRDGLQAIAVLDPEPEFPKGLIAFVTAPELGGIVLLFWSESPNPALLAQMPPSEPWE
ncbi:hypothetical protein KW783_01525 [Candidatus Parcubacteria bacterium]|nr:hypothetical protein [Candidatus Parcubacteria bacterium]